MTEQKKSTPTRPTPSDTKDSGDMWYIRESVNQKPTKVKRIDTTRTPIGGVRK